ncbi:MAG: winged helix-turn-helix transcriptional regulator [Myxococcota bacterium]
MPPSVEYSLTELGRSLTLAVEPLIGWAQANHRAIADRRAEYDRS